MNELAVKYWQKIDNKNIKIKENNVKMHQRKKINFE